MNNEALIDLLLETMTLKRMPRAGWQMRGVPHVESVAEHSYGVVFVALALADALESEADGEADRTSLNLEKVLVMALLHDLAEVRLADLPASAACLIPPAVKSQAQASAMEELLAPLPGAERWRTLWQEFEDRASPEGRLVHDADKLEMMLQCLRYEQSGSRGLDEFWRATDQRQWHYSLCADLYRRLRQLRL